MRRKKPQSATIYGTSLVMYMADEELKELLKQLLEEQQALKEQVSKKPAKDFFDRFSAFSPIVSATIIACVGTYFTYSYNLQQLRVQEVQTIERFIPHLVGDEKSKRAAVLAMSSLGDTRLAAKMAALFASEGTVSALKQIAQRSDNDNKSYVNTALVKALETVSQNYKTEQQYERAIAASKEALAIKEKTFGQESPMVVEELQRLSDLHLAKNDLPEAKKLLERALSIERKISAPDSEKAKAISAQLASLYSEHGEAEKAEQLLNSLSEPDSNHTTGEPGTAGHHKEQRLHEPSDGQPPASDPASRLPDERLPESTSNAASQAGHVLVDQRRPDNREARADSFH